MPRWFKPLKQIVDVVFRHDLALRRDADGVRVVLNDRSCGAGTGRPTPAEEAAARQKQEVDLMRSQLVALLDERPETRNASRHLAFVEQALGKKSLRALDELPLEVVRQAREQLEGLVINWSPVGLASLRARMAVAILKRESMDPDAGPDSDRATDRHDTGPPRDAVGAVVLDREDEAALEAAYAAYAAMKSASVLPTEAASPHEDKLRQLQT